MMLTSLLHLNRLRSNQWLKRSELEEIQRKKLQRIVKHAYENVKYYRRLFDSVRVKPENIRTVEDLSKIPITTKSHLQSLSLNDIVAGGVNLTNCVKIRTSGSTGMPLLIIRTQREHEFLGMFRIRSFMENGLRLWDKRASIRAPEFPAPRYWFENLGIMRKKYIHYDGTSKTLEALQRVNPDIIVSDPPILKLLSQELRNKKNVKIRPRAIFSSAELLEPGAYDLIESAFKTKVFDYYAAHEFGFMAWECSKHEGYHINIDGLVVEFLRNEKKATPGQWGELICTGLCSYAMPFIRYRIGDIGIPSDKQCSCGRGLPLMTRLKGRSGDIVKLPSGRVFFNATFWRLLGDIKGIKQYRVVQEEIDKLVIFLAKDEYYSSSISKQIKKKITDFLHEDIDVEVKIVDNIPRDPSGKFRALISKVEIDKRFL